MNQVQNCCIIVSVCFIMEESHCRDIRDSSLILVIKLIPYVSDYQLLLNKFL